MQNPNGMGGMIPQPPKPQNVGVGPEQPMAAITANPQLSGAMSFDGQRRTFGRPDRFAAIQQAQERYDSLANQLSQAQQFGAPPNVLQGIQSELMLAHRALQEANMAQQQAAQQSMLEQQMARAQRERPGAGPVGGGGVDQGASRRGIASLEDAMLANMLGLGGVGGRRY
jgi:hypothetical protein